MEYLLFIVLISGNIGLYFYYEKKLSMARKRLRITSNQFNSIRNEYRTALTRSKNINVKFITPTIKTAITNTKADVYLAPIPDSPKIKTLNVKMEVKILDSAIINNDTWFYVSLPIDSDYNCRGWVNENEFSYIYKNSTDVSNRFR